MESTSETIADVLTDPCTSRWLQAALRAAMERDPVDAANDAATLAGILSARVHERS